MTAYEKKIEKERLIWQRKILQKPSFWSRKTSAFQGKFNSYLPEKLHQFLTFTIKNMVKAVLVGSVHTPNAVAENLKIQEREYLIQDKINFYKNTAAAEGGLTGLGGLLTGLADFPLFLSIKIKMLFEIGALYGFDVSKISERIFILHIFQLTFSSQLHRQKVLGLMSNWDAKAEGKEMASFDWKTFQQEYRDHIDLAKLAQLLPGVGAAVGYLVNKRLTNRLGVYAMNAYRTRLLSAETSISK